MKASRQPNHSLIWFHFIETLAASQIIGAWYLPHDLPTHLSIISSSNKRSSPENFQLAGWGCGRCRWRRTSLTCGFLGEVHPGRLTWNQKITQLKREKTSSKPSFSGSMFIFQGVTNKTHLFKSGLEGEIHLLDVRGFLKSTNFSCRSGEFQPRWRENSRSSMVQEERDCSFSSKPREVGKTRQTLRCLQSCLIQLVRSFFYQMGWA